MAVTNFPHCCSTVQIVSNDQTRHWSRSDECKTSEEPTYVRGKLKRTRHQHEDPLGSTGTHRNPRPVWVHRNPTHLDAHGWAYTSLCVRPTWTHMAPGAHRGSHRNIPQLCLPHYPLSAPTPSHIVRTMRRTESANMQRRQCNETGSPEELLRPRKTYENQDLPVTLLYKTSKFPPQSARHNFHSYFVQKSARNTMFTESTPKKIRHYKTRGC